MHDLVIRGGYVVDGTGAVARTADVAIDDGRITEVGAVGDKVVTHFFDVRIINDLDSVFLKLSGIRSFVCQIICDESYAMANLMK